MRQGDGGSRLRALARAGAGAALLLGVAAPGAHAGSGGATEAFPPLGLTELSGLAASAQHPGVLWAVEDGSVGDDDRSRTRAYDASGEVVATVTLDASWNNRDTEAVAIGPGPTLWVADIGDNVAVRESVVVHTFAEPSTLGDSEVAPVSYRLRFPDGPRDAETFLVDPVDGRAYVATKSLAGRGSLYALPSTLEPGATHDLTFVDSVPSWVTDGSFTPDGRRLVLLSAVPVLAGEALVVDVVRPADGGPIGLGSSTGVRLPALAQAEGLTVTPDGSMLLVAGEGGDEPVWGVGLPPSTAAPTTPSEPDPEGGTGGEASSAGSGASVPGSGGTTAGAADDGCDWRDPGSCLGEPLGWLAVAGILLVGVLAGALAVLRRAR